MGDVRFRVGWGPAIAVLAVAAVAAVAGCGSGGGHKTATASTTRSASRAPAVSGRSAPGQAPPGAAKQTIPTPSPTGIPAGAAAVRVIRGWSDALRRGDVRRAAEYFALPSKFINPGPAGEALVTAIGTQVVADAVNASLPCGARFISADQRGRFVNALFRLTDRPGLGGGGCGAGVGQTARANFVIARHHILEWIRAPDDPGDNSLPSPQGPGSEPPAPQPGPSA